MKTDKVECNTCEYCLASPLYRGVCTKVEPNHIFTEEDRKKWFVHGQKPDWCPIHKAIECPVYKDEELREILRALKYANLADGMEGDTEEEISRIITLSRGRLEAAKVRGLEAGKLLGAKEEREKIEEMLSVSENEMGFIEISNHVPYKDWQALKGEK